ncbi:hypothetical protein XELAEV_18034096mg [Xenopus laevis]|uniref:NXPE C-terminal domain-containing protein n=1 Tax=Xenopus laevis TaxID=8355 RepID=A0A974HEZ6_XENLA|nr:hypothetical protein XELAEV_18034096mg [Xenopus laevis]
MKLPSGPKWYVWMQSPPCNNTCTTSLEQELQKESQTLMDIKSNESSLALAKKLHSLEMTQTNESSSSTALEQELQTLMKVIEWPEPPGPTDYEFSTSPNTTEFHMLFPRATYYVGEYVQVLIIARDHRGRPKAYGGDYFQAKLHSPMLKAGVTGSVTDHRNGTYTASFILLWPGQVEISITLVHSTEAIAILKDKRETRPDKVSFFGYFHGTNEKTDCNVELLGPDVCEYNDPNTGELWFCKRPKQIPCSAYKGHSLGGNRNILTPKEAQFLNQSVRDTDNRDICSPGVPVPDPSGFYFQDFWESRACRNKAFPKPSDVTKCLSGKVIYISAETRHLYEISIPQLAVDTTHKFVVRWQVHEKPVTMSYIDKEEEFYVQRLSTIRDAVLRLMKRNPLVKVFIKSGNTGYLYSHGSDWLSLQLDLVMRTMFSRLPVTILDAWQMTNCHYEPQHLHPGPIIVKNQIDLMLSFICPPEEITL